MIEQRFPGNSSWYDCVTCEQYVSEMARQAHATRTASHASIGPALKQLTHHFKDKVVRRVGVGSAIKVSIAGVLIDGCWLPGLDITQARVKWCLGGKGMDDKACNQTPRD